MIHYKSGFKYQLSHPVRWSLTTDLVVQTDYRNRYYWINKERREYGAYIGCAWDGASGPLVRDRKFLMEPSLRHDILHLVNC